MYWKVTEARFRRWNSAKPNLHSNEGSSALWGWQLWHKKGLALFICDSRCLCSTVLGDAAEEVKYKKLSLFKLVRRAARKAQPVCVFLFLPRCDWAGENGKKSSLRRIRWIIWYTVVGKWMEVFHAMDIAADGTLRASISNGWQQKECARWTCARFRN